MKAGASTPPGRADAPAPIGRLWSWLRGLGHRRNGEASLRESIEEIIERDGKAEVEGGTSERSMLRNLLRFGELRVDDVAVPRADIIAVEVTASLDEVVRTMSEAGHSRLPVFRETLDDIVGMVHVRDILRFWGGERPSSLLDLTRQVLFVPPSMPAPDLLVKMRAARIHMALVVDEYGGIDGLVTIEDLVEEIVGEIEDEHDRPELPMLVELPGGVIEAAARLPVEDLEARLGLTLLDAEAAEDIETLGGLVFSLVGRIPARGELIGHPAGVQFEVLDADPRRIKRLRIHRPAAPR